MRKYAFIWPCMEDLFLDLLLQIVSINMRQVLSFRIGTQKDRSAHDMACTVGR